MDNIVTVYLIKVTDEDEIQHTDAYFSQFTESFGYDAELTEDATEAMAFESMQAAEDYIMHEIYGMHPLWRVSSRYSLKAIPYNKVDWDAVRTNLWGDIHE